jgi:hypothetical protein
MRVGRPGHPTAGLARIAHDRGKRGLAPGPDLRLPHRANRGGPGACPLFPGASRVLAAVGRPIIARSGGSPTFLRGCGRPECRIEAITIIRGFQRNLRRSDASPRRVAKSSRVRSADRLLGLHLTTDRDTGARVATIEETVRRADPTRLHLFSTARSCVKARPRRRNIRNGGRDFHPPTHREPRP